MLNERNLLKPEQPLKRNKMIARIRCRFLPQIKDSSPVLQVAINAIWISVNSKINNVNMIRLATVVNKPPFSSDVEEF